MSLLTTEQTGRIVRSFFNQKQLMKTFWGLINENSKHDFRLELLKYYSNITIRRTERWKPIIGRIHFNSLKKIVHPMGKARMKKCFICGERPDVRHHIVQIKNGGSNAKNNVVPLCNYHHAEIHPHLKGIKNSAFMTTRPQSTELRYEVD